MKNRFERYKKVREFLLSIVHELTTEQLNHIPAGFSNNIIWNIGHVIAAQQAVCYRRAGLPLKIESHFFETFKPGTKPDIFFSSNEIDSVKSLLLSTIDDFEKDYLTNEFANYEIWITRYGAQISNIEVAAEFIFFHEGIHLGCVMALKKCLYK